MSDDAFRRLFKYYKARNPPPDLSLPLNLAQECLPKVATQFVCDTETESSKWLKYGLKPPDHWEAFTIEKNKGLIYLKNPFYSIGQRFWITRCLRNYPKKPHKLNLDAHNDLANIDDWWDEYLKSNPDKAKYLKKSLRWATLGYHHDWDTKVYTEKNRHIFPQELAELCKMIMPCFGFDNYSPEASIVNYYHMNATLAPHTDHSEKNLDAPLISISFGQSAIFLIGGESKSIEPTAIFLHSGDILIMSKESRLCYHAVPRIIKADKQSWEIEDSVEVFDDFNADANDFIDGSEELNDKKYWKPFGEYLQDSRININVRQVLHHSQNNLDDAHTEHYE